MHGIHEELQANSSSWRSPTTPNSGEINRLVQQITLRALEHFLGLVFQGLLQEM